MRSAILPEFFKISEEVRGKYQFPSMASTNQKKERLYDQTALEEAVQKIVNNEISLHKASSTYKIPKGTLHNKIHGKSPMVCKKGPSTILSKDDEDHIAAWVGNMAKIGYPVVQEDVKEAVAQLFEKTGQPGLKPGKKWFRLFMNRHPELTQRHAEVISKARAAVTEGSIRKWFSDLYKYLQEDNYEDIMTCPERIFNLDETGVQLCPKTGIILAPKNYKSLYTVASGQEKQSVTVLCNFSASGGIVPPFIVYPLQRLSKEIAQSVPDEWGIGRSDTGWMTGSTFLEYMQKIFLPWVQNQNITFPIVLFVDGHKSHFNMKLHDFCVEHKIILYCLHPNTTHILQPCDVGIFGPLKAAWKDEVRKHKFKENVQLTRSNFAKVFAKAFDKSMTENVIKSAFKVCGLYPLNPDAVNYSKCILSRRNEILNNITLQDYNTTISVIEKTVSKKTLVKYNDYRSQNKGLKSTLFTFWDKCKNKVDNIMFTQSNIDDDEDSVVKDPMLNQSNVASVATKSTERCQQEDCSMSLGFDSIVEGFLNIEHLPMDIEGCDILLDDARLIDDLDNRKDPTETLNLIDHTTENNVLVNDSVNSQKHTSGTLDLTIATWTKPVITSTPVLSKSPIPLPWYTNIEKKILGVHNSITEEPSCEKTNVSDLFKLPEDRKSVKRKLKMGSAMPLAITSKKFKEYLEDKENEKTRKSEEILKRKIEREQKKAEKENIAKEKKSKAKKTKSRSKKDNDPDYSQAGTSHEGEISHLTQQSIHNATPSDTETPKNYKMTDTKDETRTARKNVTEVPDISNIDIDTYVVAEFKTNKRNRYYVGVVVECDLDTTFIKVKFLRKKSSKLNKICYFVEPSNVDLTEITIHVVKEILTEPRVGRRGMLYFIESNFDLNVCE